MHLTREELKYRYDYVNGWLYNKSTERCIGCVGGKHIQVWIDGIQYKAHRVIWFWHFGTLPEQIDHIDRDNYNNKIENLRDCSNAQNQMNVARRKFCGIYKCGNKWKAILGGGAYGYIGLYETKEDARDARNEVGLRIYGEFFTPELD